MGTAGMQMSHNFLQWKISLNWRNLYPLNEWFSTYSDSRNHRPYKLNVSKEKRIFVVQIRRMCVRIAFYSSLICIECMFCVLAPLLFSDSDLHCIRLSMSLSVFFCVCVCAFKCNFMLIYAINRSIVYVFRQVYGGICEEKKKNIETRLLIEGGRGLKTLKY